MTKTERDLSGLAGRFLDLLAGRYIRSNLLDGFQECISVPDAAKLLKLRAPKSLYPAVNRLHMLGYIAPCNIKSTVLHMFPHRHPATPKKWILSDFTKELL